MRVLIISGEDLAGGGHRAAFRLHQALRGIGVESFMAVRRKHSSDPYVHQMTSSELGWPPIGRGYLDLLPSFLCRRTDEPISLGLQSANLERLVDRLKPDVVNLHWVNGGIAGIRAIGALQVPVIWTLHDMWTFTGGCHYSGTCTQYRETCARCPKIRSLGGANMITRWVISRKREAWGNKPIHAITPSAWMRELAMASSLFAKANITHIRNCVDPNVFKGDTREETRQELGLAPSTKAVLFSSADQHRKGALIIPEVVKILRNTPSTEWRFVFMGGLPAGLQIGNDMIVLPRTTDEAHVASYYAAADVYALPSLEDNLPNTVSESLCCGTPVAAFPTGGIIEMLRNGGNGLVTTANDATQLAAAIRQIISSSSFHRQTIANEAHTRYSPENVASLHSEFFTSITARQATHNALSISTEPHK
jgi:glycosyltransferase involved in cell wall biosynthesis